MILFFRYGHGVARDGFLLEGETGGIHSVVILLFVVLKMDEAKQNYFAGGKDLLCLGSILVWRVFPAQEGAGGMRGGFLVEKIGSGSEIKKKD